jgi:tetraacyldisaccharide 4'-kinase
MTVDEVWYSDAPSAATTRALLAPLSMAFGGITAVRNWLYDAHVLRTVPSPIPTISVGNLSVGGTGKTPVAAHFVRRLLDLGRRPAIVMRGYGDDEIGVHPLLNPGVQVYADPDRVAGIARAARDGADVAVLDDAFQHRRAGRHADIVLISAERWRRDSRVLPAGPLREPWRALRRASMVLVTHRIAPLATVACVTQAVNQVVPHTPVAALHLAIGQLHTVTGDPISIDLADVSGSRVLAVAGIGDPDSFFAQLAQFGATVNRRSYPDHHPYTPNDVASILAAAAGHKYIITTLKDAVKLRTMWPAKGAPLWYVSQAVDVSGGQSLIDTAIADVLTHT